jgi:hypothetical protein
MIGILTSDASKPNTQIFPRSGHQTYWKKPLNCDEENLPMKGIIQY